MHSSQSVSVSQTLSFKEFEIHQRYVDSPEVELDPNAARPDPNDKRTSWPRLRLAAIEGAPLCWSRLVRNPLSLAMG